MKIKILGTGCKKCNELDTNVRECVKLYNLDIAIEKINEINSKLQSLAREMKVFYLASNGVIKLNDQEASPLDPAYADTDGMRLTIEANKRIEEYIREHEVPY